MSASFRRLMDTMSLQLLRLRMEDVDVEKCEMSLDLGSLALYAGSCPSAYVSINTRLHKSRIDESLGSSDT